MVFVRGARWIFVLALMGGEGYGETLPPVTPGPHGPSSSASPRTPGGRLLEDGPNTPAPRAVTAEMGFKYPFEGKGETEVMKTSAKVEDGKLTIGLTETAGYKKYSMGFHFAPVMDGTETYFSDSDAAQVVVVWRDKDGKIVGRSTNAKPQSPKRDPKHPAADWKRIQNGPPAQLSWELKVPEGATQVEVISVYTDTLTDTPAQAPRDKTRLARGGDMPLITASFAGKFEEGRWKVATQPDDVEKTRKFDAGSKPNVGQIADTVSAVTSLLKERTGYQLIRRPTSLEGIHSPLDLDYRDILQRIDKAVQKGEIVNGHDTGFDIDPDSGS